MPYRLAGSENAVISRILCKKEIRKYLESVIKVPEFYSGDRLAYKAIHLYRKNTTSSCYRLKEHFAGAVCRQIDKKASYYKTLKGFTTEAYVLATQDFFTSHAAATGPCVIIDLVKVGARKNRLLRKVQVEITPSAVLVPKVLAVWKDPEYSSAILLKPSDWGYKIFEPRNWYVSSKGVIRATCDHYIEDEERQHIAIWWNKLARWQQKYVQKVGTAPVSAGTQYVIYKNITQRIQGYIGYALHRYGLNMEFPTYSSLCFDKWFPVTITGAQLKHYLWVKLDTKYLLFVRKAKP
jgi:hypothetical protein